MAGPTRTKTKTSKAKASAEDMMPGGTLKAAPSGHGTVLRKRGGGWTEEEHRLFLLGLQTYGRGDWRSIARNYVLTRSPSQVASHAQKYFLRLQANAANGGAKRKRKKGRSVLDITTANMYSEGLGESTSSPTKPKSSKKKADLQAKKKELARAIPPPTLEGLPSFAIPSQALVQGSAAAPYLPPPAFGTIPVGPAQAALLGGATATDASSPAAAAAAAVAAANGQMMHPMMQQMQAAAAVASGQPAPQMMMGMAPAAMAAAANSGTGNLSPAQVAQLQQMQMYQLAVYENILKRQNELMVAQQQQQHNAAAAAAVASAAGTLQAGATASNRKRLQSERDQVSESDSDSDDDDDESSDGEDDGERVMEPPSKKRRFSLVASEILINLANGGSYSGSGGN